MDYLWQQEALLGGKKQQQQQLILRYISHTWLVFYVRYSDG